MIRTGLRCCCRLALAAAIVRAAFAPAATSIAYSAGLAAGDFDVTDLDRAGLVDVVQHHDRVAAFVPGAQSLAAGLAPCGLGTPSCPGTITGVANFAPKVGESQFKPSWTNAPPSATALVGIVFKPDVAGTDVFGVGVNMHTGLLGPVLAYHVTSDASGADSLAFPVPNAPALAGSMAFAQALWIEPAWQSCSASPSPWSSSTGRQVTVLP